MSPAATQLHELQSVVVLPGERVPDSDRAECTLLNASEALSTLLSWRSRQMRPRHSN